MKPIAKLTIAGAVAAIVLSTLGAGAFDFPQDLPARKPGLWESVTTGMQGPLQIEHVKRYCLDLRSDRALHESYVLGRELSVIYEDVGCEQPKLALSANVMSGEMICRTNSAEDAETAGKDFRWTATFKGDTEVVIEEQNEARDILFSGEDHFVERQRWMGECPADQKPGDMLDISVKTNGVETYKKPPSNILEGLVIKRKLIKEAKEINERLGPL